MYKEQASRKFETWTILEFWLTIKDFSSSFQALWLSRWEYPKSFMVTYLCVHISWYDIGLWNRKELSTLQQL